MRRLCSKSFRAKESLLAFMYRLALLTNIDTLCGYFCLRFRTLSLFSRSLPCFSSARNSGIVSDHLSWQTNIFDKVSSLGQFPFCVGSNCFLKKCHLVLPSHIYCIMTFEACFFIPIFPPNLNIILIFINPVMIESLSYV